MSPPRYTPSIWRPSRRRGAGRLCGASTWPTRWRSSLLSSFSTSPPQGSRWLSGLLPLLTLHITLPLRKPLLDTKFYSSLVSIVYAFFTHAYSAAFYLFSSSTSVKNNQNDARAHLLVLSACYVFWLFQMWQIPHDSFLPKKGKNNVIKENLK